MYFVFNDVISDFSDEKELFLYTFLGFKLLKIQFYVFKSTLFMKYYIDTIENTIIYLLGVK